MKFGYVRVSSKDQNPERQIEKMLQLGIEERYIFVDKLSGKDFNRPKYQALKFMLREGDLLFVDAIDRLGRNYDGIISEWKDITRNINADIIVLENEQLFDSRKFRSLGDIGKLLEDQFLSLLSYVAEQERNKIKARQAEGIQAARQKGITFGRPKPTITDEFKQVYVEWKNGFITARGAMRKLGMKSNTFYRRVKEYEGNNQ